MKPYETPHKVCQVNEALVGYIKTFNRAKNISPQNISYSEVLNDKLLVAMAIRKGVTNPLFHEIKTNSPFSEAQWSEFLNINIRTLQRYKKDANHVYKPLQSERIFELAEVVSAGNDIFDSPEYFQLWLNSPSVALGNEKPIDLLDSSYGKELVLAELNRIEHGIFVQMLVYRLSRQKYMHELSAYGASLNGQRWNSKGVELVYTAQTRALANCEVAVHIPLGILPKDYYILIVDIPDSIPVKEIKTTDLPIGWDAIPSMPNSQAIGDAFVREGKYAVLKVPSVAVKGEFNYILNPGHPSFKRVRILHAEPFPFDPRYFMR